MKDYLFILLKKYEEYEEYAGYREYEEYEYNNQKVKNTRIRYEWTHYDIILFMKNMKIMKNKNHEINESKLYDIKK